MAIEVQTLQFTVPGPPKAKGRARFARMGKYVRTYTPEETTTYENWVKLHATQELTAARWHIPVEPAFYDVLVEVFLPVPISFPVWKRKAIKAGLIRPTAKPDFDNYAKVICDAINQMAWRDDSEVSDGATRKRYTEHAPGIVVTIRRTLMPTKAADVAHLP